MNILITGANGQLGKELTKKLSTSNSVIALSKEQLDITIKEKVEEQIFNYKPNLIIHTAAYTAVDECEENNEKAFLVNGIGAGYVAKSAEKIGARVFYISSDYVFDGKKQIPYLEEDNPNPQSIYGLSKWMGEKLVSTYENSSIIRTSWLYGHDGKNFVKTMMRLASEGKEVKVVNDQIGSPTYINDLVQVIYHLIAKKNRIYHVSNIGYCSWYEFARAIYEEVGYSTDLVLPITTKEYNAAAARPRYSVLSHRALLEENVPPPRTWRDALKEFIRRENCS